jgi:hypothetical protein
MEENMIQCPRCGGNACYVQQINEQVTTYFDFGCGFTTSTLMEVNSKVVLDTLANSPELYKDIMFVDKDNRVWFPSTMTLPGKGMVFVDGTAKENWQWAAVKAIEIAEEDKKNFPKDQTHKMDMKNIQHFEKEDFMEALDSIGFFDVAEQE